jgi:gamma-glutamylcyclotransferase
MSIIHYFAYGSNLHPLRLQQRIPSAQLVGTTTLADYELTFTKRGQDSSGKGHIQPAAGQSQVHGAVFEMAAEHIADLDRFEGAGYEQNTFELAVSGQPYSCFAYVGLATHLDDNLQPFHWYKSLIVLGAQFHGFPSHYIQTIQQTLSADDPDLHRCLHHEQLITSIQNYKSD